MADILLFYSKKSEKKLNEIIGMYKKIKKQAYKKINTSC